MKQISTLLPPQLAETWNSISDPPEEMILTDDEQVEAIRHAMDQVKKHYIWHIGRNGADEKEIQEATQGIDWTKHIDVKLVLAQSNSRKHYQQWEAEQRKKDKKDAEEKQKALVEFWTAGRMLQQIRRKSFYAYGRPLLENEYTIPLLKTVCFFLSRDPRFETELGYDLKKGLLLRGNSGRGKTYSIDCAMDNTLNPVEIFSMIDIAEALRESGEFEIKPSARLICLDDVGAEHTPIKFYGTDLYWFQDFIQLYYHKRLPFNKLIMSTNLSHKKIEDKYGYRVRSRIMDMFNVVNVVGVDMRDPNSKTGETEIS